MNRQTAIFLAALGPLCAPALAAAHDPDSTTPNCDALEHSYGDHVEIDNDLDFENGDLIFREDGEIRMVITEDDELFIGGERIELDAHGEELVGRYYDTVDDFVEDALDIAGDAAGLGISAAIQALAAVFSGQDMDDFEQRIEEEAREIEESADSMCERLRVLQEIEAELQRAVPAFEPQMFVQERDGLL